MEEEEEKDEDEDEGYGREREDEGKEEEEEEEEDLPRGQFFILGPFLAAPGPENGPWRTPKSRTMFGTSKVDDSQPTKNS